VATKEAKTFTKHAHLLALNMLTSLKQIRDQLHHFIWHCTKHCVRLNLKK